MQLGKGIPGGCAGDLGCGCCAEQERKEEEAPDLWASAVSGTGETRALACGTGRQVGLRRGEAGEAGGLRGRAAACWVVRVGLGRRGLARWARTMGFGCWAEAKLRSGPKGKGGESGPQNW